MYVAVATASRAAEEAAPVPAVRKHTWNLWPFHRLARLSYWRASISLSSAPSNPSSTVIPSSTAAALNATDVSESETAIDAL